MNHEILSRRSMLKAGSCGFGYLALANMMNEAAASGGTFQNPNAAKKSHFPARAKRVIFMFMGGGPTQWETFDHSPELAKSAGKNASGGYLGKKFNGTVLGPRWNFNRSGESGLMISEIFPQLAQHADDLCLLNGMHTDSPAHPTATIQLHTGSFTFVRPSMGAWVTYGLGTENQNLPGFVTINPVGNGGARNYGSAFLPATYQGTRVRAGGSAIGNIKTPYPTQTAQRKHLDLIQSMNRKMLEKTGGHAEIEGVIESYELAYRMQDAVPGVMDFSGEPEAVKEMYGLGDKATANFGTQCLMARRMAEAGVRFIEVSHNGWDQHNNLKSKVASNAAAIDRPIAALFSDLKQRGLFEDTLIVWGGEFGRTPLGQNTDGRRHNNRGYSMWLAGGGVKGGMRHGKTDPVTGAAIEGKVHLHDLHATMLHLMGMDHKKLTYRHAGRDFRLTDVYGEVVKEILT